jgi:SP family general alpha glucoside:H+ symporter-like MFS transporter
MHTDHLLVFATGLPMLLASVILLGFPFGTFQTMTVAYASELMPVALRPFLTTVSHFLRL